MRSIEMHATVTALALGSLLGLAAPAAPRAIAIDDTEQLIAELSSSRDNADPDLLMQLAGKRSRAACDGLIELYGKMSSIYMKRETVRALATLDGVGDAEQQALDFAQVGRRLVSIVVETTRDEAGEQGGLYRRQAET